MTKKTNDSYELKEIAYQINQLKDKSPADFIYLKGFIQALLLKSANDVMDVNKKTI